MCPYCSSACVGFGKSSSGKSRYRCKTCKRTHSKEYCYPACKPDITDWVKKMVIEGCGIRSISRMLKIGVRTVLKRILRIARSILRPLIMMGKTYEVDELCTYLKTKEKPIWIVYALRKDSGEIIDFAVGPRTKNTLRRVTNTVVLSNASKVYTDRLSHYSGLIPKNIHCTKQYGTNHIERKNLSLRTHLKRLNRRTICFSKSRIMLIACLKIYFWGR